MDHFNLRHGIAHCEDVPLPAIAEAVDIPIVLYNVPARTVTDIAVETMGRLAKIANIVAVKDASGNVARVSAQRDACGERACGGSRCGGRHFLRIGNAYLPLPSPQGHDAFLVDFDRFGPAVRGFLDAL